jgi:hypothetical protein
VCTNKLRLVLLLLLLLLQVGNSAADPPLRSDGKLAVGAAVGQGQLCVTRSHPGQPRPYTGVVSIVSGEIAEDLATYLVRVASGAATVACAVSCCAKMRVGNRKSPPAAHADVGLHEWQRWLSRRGPLTAHRGSRLVFTDLRAHEARGKKGETGRDHHPVVVFFFAAG